MARAPFHAKPSSEDPTSIFYLVKIEGHALSPDSRYLGERGRLAWGAHSWHTPASLQWAAVGERGVQPCRVVRREAAVGARGRGRVRHGRAAGFRALHWARDRRGGLLGLGRAEVAAGRCGCASGKGPRATAQTRAAQRTDQQIA